MKLKFATNNAQLNLKRWLKLSRASSAPELDSLDQAYFQKIVHSVIVLKTSFEGLEWLRFQCLAPSYMHMAGLQPGSYRYASDMWTSGPMCDLAHISSRTGTRRPAWLISAIVHIPLHATYATRSREKHACTQCAHSPLRYSSRMLASYLTFTVSWRSWLNVITFIVCGFCRLPCRFF